MQIEMAPPMGCGFQSYGLVDSVILKTNYDIANLPQSTELRAAMLKSTLDNLDRLTKDPHIAPQLLIQIAHAYERVAEMQGAVNSQPRPPGRRSFEPSRRLCKSRSKSHGTTVQTRKPCAF